MSVVHRVDFYLPLALLRLDAKHLPENFRLKSRDVTFATEQQLITPVPLSESS